MDGFQRREGVLTTGPPHRKRTVFSTSHSSFRRKGWYRSPTTLLLVDSPEHFYGTRESVGVGFYTTGRKGPVRVFLTLLLVFFELSTDLKVPFTNSLPFPPLLPGGSTREGPSQTWTLRCLLSNTVSVGLSVSSVSEHV